MNAFIEPIQAMTEFQEIRTWLREKSGSGILEITGCIDPQKLHLIYCLSGDAYSRLIVTFTEQRARELCEEYRFFDRNARYFPAKDILFYQSDIRGNELAKERIQVLKMLADADGCTVVTTFDALMNRMAEPAGFLSKLRTFRVGDTLDMNQMQKDLALMGYERSYQAETPGQFAVRGGILDIYVLTEENPYRIELWGDEIDSIRSYEASSQRSIENLEQIQICPAQEFLPDEAQIREGLRRIREEEGATTSRLRSESRTEEAHRLKTTVDALEEQLLEVGASDNLDAYLSYFTEQTVCLLDYFDLEHTIVALDEPARIVEQSAAVETEYIDSMQQRLEKGYILPGQVNALFRAKEIFARTERLRTIAFATLELKLAELSFCGVYPLQTRTVNPYNNSFELLVKDLQQYKKKNYKVILLSGSRTRAQRLTQDLADEGLNAFYTEDYDHIVKPGEVMALYGKVKRGYEYPMLKFVVISESDIFGAEKKKKKRRHVKNGEKIASFTDLSVGDYIVHENHGLGIYRGIEKIEVEGIAKDYIKIEYGKGGVLYILATQLDMIQKYSGAGERKPKLNSLGSLEWKKTKTKVRSAVKEIAGELVQLYAAREGQKGYVYGPDTVWQREFEEMFPFEETEDQTMAIEATKRDMESPKIMDRLICGDVGYGKTEIAIRAAFKAVQESKQVVYLAPTTILAQQVYNNFVQRMQDFPIAVGLLCRFRTSAQQKKTIQQLKQGAVDILVGTHRVLSKDVQYKDLGLLIVDEEQRFGVTHKEKIKKLKTNVDVLTLTATPIPRTLHMSLIGIRDMSVLEEPPVDRVPIQTYVMEYNEEMVREAIVRELARDGQVYYVFNRVNQIQDVAARVQSLVPDAAVATAHGQMKERELESIMYQFINGEIDVLVSTTIIETGLDISNVNTMIIQDADNMGLSQLYQLRGRVGRSNRTAYAFLLYKRDKMLREVAEKRLAAIKEFTDLGSGFKIAMRDLEIRGAGNLLGAQQSGHMEAVGYDLYCKMLNDAVKQAKGVSAAEDFETSIDVDMDAFIPPSYIPNEYQKLDIYKRVAGIETQEEAEEMTEELLDRFGDPPRSVCNLLNIAQVKAKAHRVYIKEITQKGKTLRIVMHEHAKIETSKIPELVKQYDGRLTFTAVGKNPAFTYNLMKNSRDTKKTDVLALLTGLTEELAKICISACSGVL
ncbi:MAG: transcription-repair coupling factor [Eubacterium sp.]|nr:transcription-repair coupling factor [Eubacterium sp.]